MSFDPQRSYRATDAEGDELYFFELFLAPGPERIGETGDNSYQTMFGHNWLVLIERETRILRAYQERGGVWTEVVEDLPPVFGTALPEGVRRLSCAFDQSARMVVAYELGDGRVTGTRWDNTAVAYIQNIDFPGVNPCLLMEAAVTYQVGGSDVWIFYQRGDAPGSVFWRKQSEVYDIEHLLFADPSIGILDRAQHLAYRYQLLVSDTSGEPLLALRSELSPIAGESGVASAASAPLGGTSTRIVFVYDVGEDSMAAQVSSPLGGSYEESVITVALPREGATAAASGPLAGVSTYVIIDTDGGQEALASGASGPLSGDYVQVIFSFDFGTDLLQSAASAPLGGSYDPA